MKIYFNRRPVLGPWGGGSKVLRSIVEECSRREHQVFFEEQIRTIDAIDLLFCIDPRPNNLVSFQDLLDYKQRRKAKLIQRIGDLGTHGKPELMPILHASSRFVDKVIFPSQWAADRFGFACNYKVISNASLQDFFIEKVPKSFGERLRIVSHHWSNNSMKGFEVYRALDDYCCKTNKAIFTFVGRAPEGVDLINHIPPQDVNGLITELPKHDIYITASKLEAGANHVLEAMAIGLPVLYHKDGGSINEYCKDRGLEYDSVEKLIWLLENKKQELEELHNIDRVMRTSIDMAKEYVDLFESML